MFYECVHGTNIGDQISSTEERSHKLVSNNNKASCLTYSHEAVLGSLQSNIKLLLAEIAI